MYSKTLSPTIIQQQQAIIQQPVSQPQPAIIQRPAATSSNQQYPSCNQQSSSDQQQPTATSSNHQQSAVINSSQHQHDQCQLLTYKTIWQFPLCYLAFTTSDRAEYFPYVQSYSSRVQHIELSLFII